MKSTQYAKKGVKNTVNSKIFSSYRDDIQEGNSKLVYTNAVQNE